MAKFLVQELTRHVNSRHAILVAGAGVTIASTGDPKNHSWQGLLRSGLQRCQDIDASLDPSWIADVQAKIASTDAASLIEGAQRIQSWLEGRPGQHFRKWLESAVGSLAPTNPGLLRAIAGLDIPVATTNYDSLLLSAVGGTPVTWQDPAGIQRVVRQEESGVIHIHGYWRDPNSVVLGVSSYASAMGDRQSQEIVHALFASHSVIFAGFGSGLDDPNFTGLRAWAREILNKSPYPPTLLVRKSEVADAEARYGADGIQVIPYGEHYSDLEIFLADLRRPTPTVHSEQTYDWQSLQIKLGRLNRRIRREWDPELVIAMSGAGNIAPNYCMSLDVSETPVVNAVTFPKSSGRSPRNDWFRSIATSCGWKHLESTKWDVFLPDLLLHLPKPTRILIFDDRVIGGTVQRSVAEWLRDTLGHEVKRAAIVVHPSAQSEVDWYEDVTDAEFTFPWGGRRGRA